MINLSKRMNKQFTIIVSILFLGKVLNAQFNPVLDDLVKNYNGHVTSMVVDEANSLLYVGGQFSTYGGARNGFEIFEYDSYTTNRTMPYAFAIDFACEDGDGGWLVAFDTFAGLDSASGGEYHFARIHADRSIEELPIVINGVTSSYKVTFMKLVGDMLIVKNNYQTTTQVYNWQTGEPVALLPQTNGTITNYDVLGNELILSGTFTEVNGQPRELVCSIDLQTFELTDYAVELDYTISNYSSRFAKYIGRTDEFTYYLYGTVYFQTTYCSIEKISNEDGSLVEIMTFPSYNYNYSDFHLFESGDLYFKGYSTATNSGSISDYMPHFNLNEPLLFSNMDQKSLFRIYTMYHKQGKLYVAGSFSVVDSEPRSDIAVFDVSNFELLPDEIPYNGSLYGYTFGIPGDNGILMVAISNPSNVDKIGGLEQKNFSVIDIQTGIPVDVPFYFSNINAMALTTTGDSLFIHGNLNSGIVGVYLYHVDTQTLDSAPVINVGNLLCMEIVEDKLFVSEGPYTNQDEDELFAFDLATLDPIPSGITLQGGIKDFEIYGDTLIVCGSFSSINGVAISGLAMLNKNTMELLPWNAHLETIMNSYYTSNISRCDRVLVSDNKLYAFGWIGPPAGVLFNTVAAAFDLLTAERIPSVHVPVAGNVCNPRSVSKFRDYILISGDFASTTNSKGDLCILSSTSGESQWLANGNSIYIFYSSAVGFGDKIFGGGNFTNYAGDTDLDGLITLDIGCFDTHLQVESVLNVCPLTTAQTEVMWFGSEPDYYTWQYKLEDDTVWIAVENDSNWYANGAQITALALDSTYNNGRLRVLAISECDTAYSIEIVIQVSPIYSLGIVATDYELCAGQSAIFSAAIYDNTTWPDGIVPNQPITYNETGIFYYYAENLSFCATDTFQIQVNELPEVVYSVVDSLNCNYGNATVQLESATGADVQQYLYQNALNDSLIYNYAYQDTIFASNQFGCITEVVPVVPFLMNCTGCTDVFATNYNPQAIFPADCTIEYVACTADINGDGYVDMGDLNILLANFGCVESCNSDLDQDGIVGMNDVLIIIDEMFSACED